MSSEKIVVSASTAGVSPSTILRASPSAIAVLPTPGSPTSSGLFLRRRQSTWMQRSTSRSRPISGSTSPRRAFSFRSTQYFCNAVSSASLDPWRLCLRLGRGLGALHRTGLAIGRILGDAVADVVDRVVAGHVLLLQEIRGMALAFREDRDEHVRAGHLRAARALDVDRRALDHPLEAGGRRRLGAFDVGDQRVELLVEEGDDGLAQLVEIDPAGLHHPGRIGLVDQRQQQMFERRQLVLALVGLPESVVDCGFQGTRERGHRPRPSV